MAIVEKRHCPRCKSLQGAIEKMGCWICARCRIIVAHKTGTLQDVLSIIKEQKDASQTGREPKDC